ncbi:hypothetical protein D9619_012929 [Psilocybe cf. subviscida]|uniref:Beta-lactamase-related domain-containing protein n=1 Tax=Psilocybe cf. subviscida TaxID=2480587 RepID=A0A8H5BKE9_9AGAR|nr:hypothetical protein D9619_012929 [Psilocybe cf. subviscida]
MLVYSVLALLSALTHLHHAQGLHIQAPLSLESNTGDLDASISKPRLPVSSSPSPCKPLQSGQLISECTERYIDTVLTKWNSSGLAVAVVRRSASGEWSTELGGYGIATADGKPVTPDTLFAIASNSKLFLSLSVGLLIKNETLAKERGKKLDWTTEIRDVIPEWGLMDEDADRGTTILDMLSHRTGLPRHDFAGTQRLGSVAETISALRHLRPSASFRETFQYNNMMYETLSYLTQVLLNQTFESYVSEHLFGPLNMTSSTYSVAEAEASGNLAHGFGWDGEDATLEDRTGEPGKNGTRIPMVPYFQRPGEEKTWAGAGGVLTSARDLATWTAMLLNNGRHPITNVTIVPEDVLELVSRGRTVTNGEPPYPEVSVKVYGGGQWRYSYQGRDLIEHGGSNPGFKTQVTRLPRPHSPFDSDDVNAEAGDDLAVVALSNDERGGLPMEAVKWRFIDEVLGLKKIEWNDRYERQYNSLVSKAGATTPPPSPATLPSRSFESLAEQSFNHPTYGLLQPCLVPESLGSLNTPNAYKHHHAHCASFLKTYEVQRILSAPSSRVYANASEAEPTPTYIIPFKRYFATHLRLAHFDKNTFNVTVLWSNADARRAEGYANRDGTDGGDVILGWDERYEVEWVVPSSRSSDEQEEEGLAFKGGIWGKEGLDSRTPEGTGKDSAEVWFAKV